MPLLRSRSITRLSLASLALCSATLALAPAPAQACGGTFCDTGPTSMPVDQTGENILFILDGSSVEAHIQIQYDPTADAEKFAWVVPMQVLPEFSVGSEALFDALLSGTVPTYGMTTSFENCPSPDEGGESGSGGDGDWTSTGDGDGDPGTPEVVYNEVVGAFEIAVLQGGTIEGVMQWLADNGYQQDPNAEPILAEYLDAGYMFVALKLAMNHDVDELHPIVLKYAGDEPCVPLKLTRIAAVDDMAVRVFFLGQARAVPTNYRHVLVNDLKIDWINLGANYKEVVSLAVDAESADGNAFVTEYAGSSDTVPTSAIYSPAWDATVFAAMVDSPVTVVEQLSFQDLASCDQVAGAWTCDIHPLVEPLLAQYVLVPDGILADDFYACLSCYEGLIDLAAWDAAAFAATLDERVFAPGAHAIELIATNSYLTRMYTTISPNEMTVDPIFHTNADLPEVSNLHNGVRTIYCDGTGRFVLPDGRIVNMPNPFVWPDIAPDEMPWEEDVELAVMAGPSQVLSDRTELIDELLAAWNMSHPGGEGPMPPGADDVGDESRSGCGCTSGSGSDTPIGATLALFGLAGLALRRSRQSNRPNKR